ncbi:hypothetical protein V1264_022840 [Littorina saxatilis]|uniref:Carboxylesterase type B domain-containing protein n=1 Tax=Littorina saxatilis TaxID=31220 RepID=A0AAN9B732_9CAEN
MLAAKGEVTGSHFLTGATKDEGLIAAQGLFGERFKMEGTQKLMAMMNCFRGDLPQVHGIVESILEAYAKWPYNMNDDEIKDHFSEIIGDYFILAPTHKMASVMAALNLTVFVYNYEYMSELSSWGAGVIHGAELFYLAGFPIKGNNNNYRYDDSDKHMARLLLQLWANFAKNGLPSLVPVQNFHMPRFTLSHRSYTRFFSSGRTPTLNVQHDLKPDKLAFWNMQVPRMYQRQLDEMKRYPPAGTVISRHTTFTGRGGENEGGDREITPHDSTELNTQLDGSDVGAGSGKAPPDEYLTRHGSNSWILIAACIGLSLLTVLLSVCYCQVRRQVNNLIRQSSVSSGQPIL